MEEFLQKYKIKKETNEKPTTHTSMKGGKWSIPENKLPEFYKLTQEHIVNGPENKLLVEKMRNYFPFVIDIDLKYNSVLEERQYNNDTIDSLLEYLWSKITEYIQIDDISGKGIAFLMEKVKPYPCDKQNFKTKDGIHLGFPELIIEKQVFIKMASFESLPFFFVTRYFVRPYN